VWIGVALLGVLLTLAVVAGIVRIHSLTSKARQAALGPPQPSGPEIPLPAPPLAEALTPERHVVVGTMQQTSSARHPFEPAAFVDVENWLSRCSLEEQRQLGHYPESGWLEAWLPGRPQGRPFPPADPQTRFVVIIGKAPKVMRGPNYEVCGQPFELIAAYQCTNEVLAEVEGLLRAQGRHGSATSAPADAP
jgi:hypothetical protein